MFGTVSNLMQSAASYAADTLGAQPGVPVLEHSALPEAWGLSPGCKVRN